MELECIGEQLHMHSSKGLGDSIEKFTTKTGVKSIVDKVSQGLNVPCGCQQRKMC